MKVSICYLATIPPASAQVGVTGLVTLIMKYATCC